jgi:hypothetical protein
MMVAEASPTAVAHDGSDNSRCVVMEKEVEMKESVDVTPSLEEPVASFQAPGNDDEDLDDFFASLE